jgi:hypothetical protein
MKSDNSLLYLAAQRSRIFRPKLRLVEELGSHNQCPLSKNQPPSRHRQECRSYLWQAPSHQRPRPHMSRQ